ncbi:MAG: ribonuclease P protein component [Aeromicrobium sp.]|nr:ribonuclease P protein component [Burkholderiales bacterium]
MKNLLGHGQRASASTAGVVLTSRSLVPLTPLTRSPAKSAIAARIALAVPKRQLKRAVDRNRAKRILREIFRQHAIRSTPLEMLVTISAVPKALAGNLKQKQATSHLRSAALGLFNRILQRSKKITEAS